MQGNVIGEVFYSDSRTPVIGAEVRIGGNATYTDLNGRFALSNVGVGTYNLEILHYRIEPLSMQVTVELIAM